MNHIKLNLYTLKLQHDNGTISINTMAHSPESAKTKVMLSEGCPECAILSIHTTKKSKP